MPIYDYICPHCGNAQERVVPSANTVVDCPKCDYPMERKVSSTASFRFNGGGFYATDFKSK